MASSRVPNVPRLRRRYRPFFESQVGSVSTVKVPFLRSNIVPLISAMMASLPFIVGWESAPPLVPSAISVARRLQHATCGDPLLATTNDAQRLHTEGFRRSETLVLRLKIAWPQVRVLPGPRGRAFGRSVCGLCVPDARANCCGTTSRVAGVGWWGPSDDGPGGAEARLR